LVDQLYDVNENTQTDSVFFVKVVDCVNDKSDDDIKAIDFSVVDPVPSGVDSIVDELIATQYNSANPFYAEAKADRTQDEEESDEESDDEDDDESDDSELP